MKSHWIKSIWNDSVGSKVIAAGLIFLLSQLGIFIWGLFIKLNFIQAYNRLFTLLNTKVEIKSWIIVFSVFVFILVIIITICRIKKASIKISSRVGKSKGIQNIKKESTSEKNVDDEIRIEPTVFFHQRFIAAFPGFSRGYQVFDSRTTIKNRLKILLAPPLKFEKGEGYGIDTRPIWWFRGGSALPIEHFKILDRKKVLINFDELIIEKIIAYRGSSYFQDYVYIQCKADKATGLYEHYQLNLEEAFEDGEEYNEEFAVFRKRFISRQDFDDGSTIIWGKPVKTIGAELRSRTLIKYNFIVCAKFAPYNCQEFCRESKDYFKKLLKNEISFDNFAIWMNKFPKNHND